MYRPVSGTAILRLLQLLIVLALVVAGNLSAQTQAEGIQLPNPGTDLWREVRQRAQPATPGPTSPMRQAPGIDLWSEVQQTNPVPAGNTQVKSVDSGMLINPVGDQWRRFRMEMLVPYSGYALGGALLLTLAFYLIRGRVPIHAGPSDKRLLRYTVYERMIHWFIAAIFLFLALTGLTMLFGRSLLIPLLGPEAFSLLASASKEGHNLFGPLFLLALALIFFRFVRRNIYQRGDLTWLLRGGGVIGSKHVPSNFFNMGEKSMFWMLVLVGGVTALSGIILVFPILGLGRELMALSHVAHGVTAMAMMVVIVGHIYIGSIGMEGALEGMATGYCDLNWAREHHDWWAEQCEQNGEVVSVEEAAGTEGFAQGAPKHAPLGETGK